MIKIGDNNSCVLDTNSSQIRCVCQQQGKNLIEFSHWIVEHNYKEELTINFTICTDLSPEKEESQRKKVILSSFSGLYYL